MICYEMIGYFSEEPGSQHFPDSGLAKLYLDTGNFIIVVGITKFEEFNHKVYSLMVDNSAIDIQIVNFPSSNYLAGLSDQRNYWEFGYNALMINDTSFARNPHYHQASDTINTLDFNKMTEVVNSTYNAVIGFNENKPNITL